VRLLTSAAEKDDVVGKHPVTPGDVLPVRELLGDLLLELGRPRQALDAYEAALAGSPRRFNGLLGAARAARALGERERAAGYYRALADQVVPETTRVAELAEARAYLEEAGVGGGPG
jgi:tetratricopeptide (TPR) repeat protein